MKTIKIIIALFALFVALKSGMLLLYPGNNIMVIEDVQYGEETLPYGVIYDEDAAEVGKIPMDMIIGVGAIMDPEKPAPGTEM